MEHTQLLDVIDIMIRITQYQNKLIRTQGEIKADNKELWRGYLHNMDNELWQAIIDTVFLIDHCHPGFINLTEYSAFDQAQTLLNKYNMKYDRVLDIKNIDGKKIAWRCFMTIRDIINKAWEQ